VPLYCLSFTDLQVITKRKSTKGQEELEDTKGVIRTHVSKKNRQHNGQKKKKTKGQTTIYKTYT
jgi:hypothetical protein